MPDPTSFDTTQNHDLPTDLPIDPAIQPASTEAVQPDGVEADGMGEFEGGEISSPAKIIRIGGMVKQLLEAVKGTELDESARDRLRDIYENSLTELKSALSPDLSAELDRLALPFDDDTVPSESSLLVAKAQLVGWLEGLFHGIQATLMAQQMDARRQLEGMRGQLPAGGPPQPGGTGYI